MMISAHNRQRKIPKFFNYLNEYEVCQSVMTIEELERCINSSIGFYFTFTATALRAVTKLQTKQLNEDDDDDDDDNLYKTLLDLVMAEVYLYGLNGNDNLPTTEEKLKAMIVIVKVYKKKKKNEKIKKIKSS